MAVEDEILEAFGGQTYVREKDGDLEMVNRVEVGPDGDTQIFQVEKAMAVIAGVTTDKDAEFEDIDAKVGMIIGTDDDGKKVMLLMGPEAWLNVWGDMALHVFTDDVLKGFKEVLNANKGKLYRRQS